MDFRSFFDFLEGLTGATRRTTLCVATLFPDVGGVGVYLARMGLLIDDVIPLGDIFTC